MKNSVKAILTVAVMACLIPAASFALDTYTQDFEELNQADTAALTNDGWLIFGNVFGLDWAYWYGYGVFGAPNDGAAFCAIVMDEGGAEQGMQQLSVFSDYNNTDHPNAYIEANVFQEQEIMAGDEGTYLFDFQAKKGNLEGLTTALAFIKTLDPANGYATTNFITVDMTATPDVWTGYQLTIEVDGALVGQLVKGAGEGIQSRGAGGGMVLVIWQVGVKLLAGDIHPLEITPVTDIDIQRDDGNPQFFDDIDRQVTGGVGHYSDGHFLSSSGA